ncbi:MAG TPA: SHOCT domain-containing protein [Candidatus Scatomorpha merdigallinarum]|nr:SHOCT domain-containing protein [Candidatus Scatomorpha merdigallinarum]
MSNRRRKRITYKPSGASRVGAVINMVVGLIFIVIGFTMIMPMSVAFGVIWCLICAAMIVTSAYLAFGGTKHISPEVYIEDEEVQNNAGSSQSGARPEASDVEDRLIKLSELHDKGLITDAEYEKKRQEILDEI